MKEDLVVSFSGGKTSAYMSWFLINRYSDKYNLHFVFANTGQEHENTLEFVDRCDKEFGLGVVWLESVLRAGRKSCGHRVVDFASASRKGEPFEQMIIKYGIPNKSFPHCTRELKINPVSSYERSIGLNNPIRAIGIRLDEDRRKSDDKRLVYPLCDWEPTDKIDVNNFWESMPFNLEIMEHQGNCLTCFKKSDRKLFMIAKENPEWFEFNSRMENKYKYAGATDERGRVFFRSNRSTEVLLVQAEEHNKNAGAQRTIFDLDENGGCTESCEAY